MNKNNNLELSQILIELKNIDYLFLFFLVRPVISFYLTDTILNNYKVHKDYKPKDISLVTLPPELIPQYDAVNIEQQANEYITNAIKDFATLMIKTFPKENLINFYNNINELIIKEKPFKFKFLSGKSDILAFYNVKNKTIEFKSNHYPSIYHELFHMASSVYKDANSNYSGFHQCFTKGGNIGRAINEGYTQLLTERYFGHLSGTTGYYLYEVKMVKSLEKIVGKDTMEKLYLNSNLYGLINELSKYTDTSQTMNFITKTDFFSKYYNNKKLILFKDDMLKESLNYACAYLIATYLKKLDQDKKENIISYTEYIDKACDFIRELAFSFKIGKHSYDTSIDLTKNTLNIINNKR